MQKTIERLYLSPKYYIPFGDHKVVNIPSNIFTGLHMPQEENYIYQTFATILTEKYDNVNLLAITNVAMSLLKNNKLLTIILEIVNIEAEKFSIMIQKMLNDETYTNKSFLDMYTSYIRRMTLLKNSVRLLQDYIKTTCNKNLLNIYVNYLFYYNVVNKQYILPTKEQLYLYQLLIKYNNFTDAKELFTCFKLYNYFTRFTYSIKNKDERVLYFNTDLEKLFAVTDDTNTESFIKIVMTEVDIAVKKACDTNGDDELNEAINYVKMCKKIYGEVQSAVIYLKYLQNRLIGTRGATCNINVETKIASLFSITAELELYIKMRYSINDVALSSDITHSIHNIGEVKFLAEKYAGIDTSKLNKNNCNYLLVRNYAWGDGIFKNGYVDKLNHPQEISFYLDVLGKMMVHPDCSLAKEIYGRKLLVDYDNSTGIIDMVFGNKKYTFNATLGQIILLMVINNSGKISAKNLSEVIGAPLKNLSTIINSLMSTKLITRSSTAPNDPEMIFYIKDDWSCDSDYIDLVKPLETIKMKSLTIPISQVNSKTDHINNAHLSTLRARILEYMVEKKSATLEDITEYTKEKLLNLPNINIEDVMEKLVNVGMLIKADKIYQYPEKSQNAVETDDESEQETNAEELTENIPIEE